MKKNALGSSELMVSEIGLGCMSLGTDEQQATRIIHEAMDAGVNFLDTADLYDAGRNEELVGKAIQGKRENVILATKVGNRRMEGQDGWVWDASRSYILSAVKQSLQRLRTDYIDLYQLHGGTLEDQIDEVIDAFEQLKQEGLIREYGISSIRPNVIREYATRSSLVSVMNQYSIVDRRAEEEVLDYLHNKQVSVIARGPLASGALASGRTPHKAILDYDIDAIVALREQLEHVASDLTQLSIRYSLSHPAVAVAIPGARTVEQLRYNLSATNMPPLTAEQIGYIRQVSMANQYTVHR